MPDCMSLYSSHFEVILVLAFVANHDIFCIFLAFEDQQILKRYSLLFGFAILTGYLVLLESQERSTNGTCPFLLTPNAYTPNMKFMSTPS